MRVADEHHVDVLVAALQEDIEQHIEPLGEVLHVLGHRAGHVHQAEHHRLRHRLRLRLEPAVAHVERIDVGDQPGAPQLARQLLLQLDAARLFLAVGAERGDLVAQLLQLLGLRPLQRDAARQAVAHRAQQREVGRRAGDRIAGAMPGHAFGVRPRGASRDPAVPGLPGTDRRTRRATGRSGNRPRPRRPGCLRSRRRRAALRARDGVAFDVLLVAGQQMVAHAAGARCGGTTVRARPAPAARPRRPGRHP